MAKTVFRPNEIVRTDDKRLVNLSRVFTVEAEVEEIKDEVPEYVGPTADDLRQEAQAYKEHWEKEKLTMKETAEKEAARIIQDAENAAFEEVRRKTDQVQVLRQEAETASREMKEKAQTEAQAIIDEAAANRERDKKNAYNEGFDKGREEGYKVGSAEAQRLVDRLHLILERTMDKRQEILSETEQQIVDLVLLIARKVIKVISENQKNIVVSNIVSALRKVKGRGDVTIRVNLADLDLSTQHKKDFMDSVENIKNITLMEDSAIDRGGCIVETDFGAIDARISSQLNELEQKILEISPIRTRAKLSAAKTDI